MCGCQVKISKAIAPLFDYKNGYKSGDVVMYHGTRYIAIADSAPNVPFDPLKWKVQTVQEALNAGGTQLILANPYEDGKTYEKYSIVEKDGKFYQAIATTSESWKDSEWRAVRICEVIEENSKKIADFITKEEADVIIEEKVDAKIEEIKPEIVEETVQEVKDRFRYEETENKLILFGANGESLNPDEETQEEQT